MLDPFFGSPLRENISIQKFFLTLFLTFVTQQFTVPVAIAEELRVNGATIRYTVTGKGSPVVIVGGIAGAASDYLSPVAKELSAKHRCIIIDMRGTGQSVSDVIDTSTINVRTILGDLEAVRAKIGIERWIVFGHSWGGMVAMAYAANFPKRVRALVLVGSGGPDLNFLERFQPNVALRLNSADSAKMTAMNNALRRTNRLKANAEEFKICLNAYVYDRTSLDTILPFFTDQGYSSATAEVVWRALFHENYDIKNALRRYPGQVLEIQGDTDPNGKETAAEIHGVLKNSRVEIMSRTGHFPWVEQRKKFYSLLLQFVDGFK